MLPDQRKGRRDARVVHAGPVVMHVQRGTMVDQPRLPLPDQQVRVARRAIGIGDERIEPDQRRGKRSVHHVMRRNRIEVERPIQIAQPDVDAATRLQQVLDLRIRLALPEAIRQVDDRQLRHRQFQSARDAMRDDLGNQHLCALAGTAELGDEQAAAVGVDDGGKRAPLTERLDVSCGLMARQRSRHEPAI